MLHNFASQPLNTRPHVACAFATRSALESRGASDMGGESASVAASIRLRKCNELRRHQFYLSSSFR